MGINMCMCVTLEVVLWGSGCAPPDAPCTKEQSLALLSPLLQVYWTVFQYLLHALDTVLGDTANCLAMAGMDVSSLKRCIPGQLLWPEDTERFSGAHLCTGGTTSRHLTRCSTTKCPQRCSRQTTFHSCCCCRNGCSSSQSIINHISPIYSDYRAALSLIFLSEHWLLLLTQNGPSRWAHVQTSWGSVVLLSASSLDGPKWIDLTWIHQFGSIGYTPGLLTHAAICCLTLGGGQPLSARRAVSERRNTQLRPEFF